MGVFWTEADQVQAKTEDVEVPGGIYTQDGKGKYTNGSYSNQAESKIPHGSLTIKANIVDTAESDNMVKYGVSNDSVAFSYSYNRKIDVCNDNSKKIGELEIGSKAKKGVLILETSKDGTEWNTSYVKTNLLKEQPAQCNEFYTATDLELASGYYYRVTVAHTYKTVDDYKSIKEVYKFYLYNSNAAKADDANAAKQALGTKTKTGKGKNGYTDEEEIKNNDSHYGWDIGNFFVSGYTTSITDTSGTPIFLKNQSDKISLWFKLTQDINKLNEKKSLKIIEDEGYDQYFETKKMDLGKGALFVRYTDYENVKHESKVYTNFLEANAIMGSNQRIQYLGEGDYEVALDYALKDSKKKVLGVFGNNEFYYRIYFKFSVRNADSNIRLYDLEDNSKLKTNGFTESGFKMNQSLSRYLDVEVKHEVYNAEENTFTEDKNLKKNAKNGGEYTDEGFYLIKAKNRYTDSQTNRIVYVGKNAFLQECAASGMKPDEIVQYVKTELERKEEESKKASEAAEKKKEERAAEESRLAAEESKRQEESERAARESAQATSETSQEESSTTQEMGAAKGGNSIKLFVVLGVVIAVVVIAMVIFLEKRKIEKQKEKARNYSGPFMTNLNDDIESIDEIKKKL